MIPINPWRLLAVLTIGAFVASCALPELDGAGTGKSSRNKSAKKPPRESSQQETKRLRDQRERAQQDGLVVFSAGTLKGVTARHGTELVFQFEHIRPVQGKASRPGTMGVLLDCKIGDCLARRLRLAGKTRSAQTRVAVVTLSPGLWRLSAARISGQAPIRFKTALPFEIRNGHATYLGAFVLTGASSGTTPKPPIARFSAVQSDMSHALDIFEQTRGRKLINTLRSASETTVLR